MNIYETMADLKSLPVPKTGCRATMREVLIKKAEMLTGTGRSTRMQTVNGFFLNTLAPDVSIILSSTAIRPVRSRFSVFTLTGKRPPALPSGTRNSVKNTRLQNPLPPAISAPMTTAEVLSAWCAALCPCPIKKL